MISFSAQKSGGADRAAGANAMWERQSRAKIALWIAVLCAAVPLVCLALPIYVIRPFVPQSPRWLAIALSVRQAGPMVAVACAVIATLMAWLGWRAARKARVRAGLVLLCVVAWAGAWGTRVNIFEKMFHPYETPVFASADGVQVDPDDRVLAVRFAGEARAYPIRTMGYHHIVNDVVGGVPIAVTYCTLCHTGIVWSRELDGRLLTFRLAGINNGNALLKDVETGTIWQQSTGEGIFGPLAGRHLELLHSDELTFSLWRREQPEGRVLRPDDPYLPEYETKDWEKHIERTRVVVDTSGSGIAGHTLMLGVVARGSSKAFPVQALLAGKVVEDRVGTVPVVIVVGPDGASIRAFEAWLDGTVLTFAASADESSMVDAESGSRWNFQGCAIAGPRAGRCLGSVESHKDYWFDWMNHHPGAAVFKG